MKTSNRIASRGGFSLIEVCLAVGIVGVCVASMQGLLPAGIRIARDTTEQTACATMLSAVASDLRYTPSSSGTSPKYGITIPTSGQSSSTNIYLSEDGTMMPSPTGARFGVAVSMNNAPSTTVSSLTTARIKVYWPPQSSVDKPQGSVETMASFNRAMQLGGVYRSKVANQSSQSSTSAAGTSSTQGGSSGGSGSSGTSSGSGSGGCGGGGSQTYSGGGCGGSETQQSSGGCSGGTSSGSGSGGCSQTSSSGSGGCGGQTQQSSGRSGSGGGCSGNDRDCGNDF